MNPSQGAYVKLAERPTCDCDHCQDWYPLIKRLEAQLDAHGRELLDLLACDWMNQSDDLGVANAKLAGDWPGWEAMKDFKPRVDENSLESEEEHPL